MANEINLVTEKNEILVSSREVAENFGKRHDKLTSEIKRMYGDLIGSPQNGGHPFFYENYYENEQNHQTYIEYLMNRDGFSLLVMGFTGKKALEWKLKYIDAFNEMEEKLKSSNILTDEEKYKLMLFSKDPAEVALAHNKLVEMATAPLIEENKQQKEQINNLSDVNRLLSEDILDWDYKPLINALVRAYASNTDNNFGKAWNEWKKELLYKYSINVNSRITNYMNNNGKKTKPRTLDMLADEELNNAAKVAVSMCLEIGVEVKSLGKYYKKFDDVA